MTDMYNPATGQHYMAQSSQVAVLEKYGWVPYATWLAAHPPATTTTTTTAPTTTTTDTTTTAPTDTTTTPTA